MQYISEGEHSLADQKGDASGIGFQFKEVA